MTDHHDSLFPDIHIAHISKHRYVKRFSYHNSTTSRTQTRDDLVVEALHMTVCRSISTIQLSEAFQYDIISSVG